MPEASSTPEQGCTSPRSGITQAPVHHWKITIMIEDRAGNISLYKFNGRDQYPVLTAWGCFLWFWCLQFKLYFSLTSRQIWLNSIETTWMFGWPRCTRAHSSSPEWPASPVMMNIIMICETHSIFISIYSCSPHHYITHLLTRLLATGNLFLELHDKLLIAREEIPPSENFI